ncbi:MAG: hypothetical protein JST94_11380 [Bacteroidetes bacterium]|nr:hypothetical protein [Bacteroidota bacterium]MBS1672027.1 hypothetical protein [Bacteroidota bacterium]
MKTFLISIIFIICSNTIIAQQRTVAECTVTYQIVLDSTTDKEFVNALNNSSKTLYIKGNLSRTDLVTTNYLQTTFVGRDTGNITILRQIGDNKLITYLTNTKWNKLNNLYDSAVFTSTNETKKIAGYDCKRINVQLKNGDTYVLYYATAIAPSVKNFEYLFKKIPGFVLEYEVQQQKGIKVKYKAVKVNLSPVAASKMEIPTTSYRLLNED